MKEILTTNMKKKAFYIALIGLLLVIGGSFAFFTANFVGEKYQVVDLKGLKFRYTEEDPAISMVNAEPMSDEDGIAQDNYFDFNIYIENTYNYSMSYNIYLKELETNTIDSKFIKVYLTDQNDNKIIGPTKISDLSVMPFDTNSFSLYDTAIAPLESGNNTQYYRLRIWLDEAYTSDILYETNGNTQTGTIGDDIFGFTVNVIPPYANLDESDANAPVLASNMIPVYYDSTSNVWKKADSSNVKQEYKWYSYNEKMWANAVTVTESNGSRSDLVDAAPGTPIPMERINTMWVWIPRFSATGDTANYNGGTKAKPGAFNITFVDINTSAHDAFIFGTNSLSGFWMGKFENSSDTDCIVTEFSAIGEGCNLTTIRPKILPNATSWRGTMVSTFFYDILAMTDSGNQYGFDKTKDTTLDTHMLKNNEWGAVAYLTQSIYGRCTSSTSCTEVGINNNSGYVTGYGAPAGSSSSVTNGTYETSLGMDASTTGNIYGVYDMSGGAVEYVMGVYWDGTKKWSGCSTDYNWNSGFNGCLGSDCSITLNDGVEYPSDNKYYNTYTNTGDSFSPVTNYTSNMQHALIETSGWYRDLSYFVAGGGPWFGRGGDAIAGASSGMFSFGISDGGATDVNNYSGYGCRSTLTNTM